MSDEVTGPDLGTSPGAPPLGGPTEKEAQEPLRKDTVSFETLIDLRRPPATPLAASPPPTAIEEKQEEKEPEKPEPTASEELIVALDRFVKEKSGSPAEDDDEGTKFTTRQIIVFLLITSDLVLGYMSLPTEILAVPVVKFATSLIPWLLGASAFAYAEKLRGWFLEKCSNRWLAAVAVLAFALLLPLHLPLFSMNIRLRPQTNLTVVGVGNTQPETIHYTEIKAGQSITEEARIGPSGLKNYKLTVKNADPNARNAKDLELIVDRWHLLKASLAQLPGIGHSFGPEAIALTPLYGFTVKSSSGLADMTVNGRFPPGYVEGLNLEYKKEKDGQYSVYFRILLQGTYPIKLPYGTYDLWVHQQSCWKTKQDWKVEETSEELLPRIDFDKLECANPN